MMSHGNAIILAEATATAPRAASPTPTIVGEVVSGRNVLCLRMDRQVRRVLPGMEDMGLVIDLGSSRFLFTTKNLCHWQHDSPS